MNVCLAMIKNIPFAINTFDTAVGVAQIVKRVFTAASIEKYIANTDYRTAVTKITIRFIACGIAEFMKSMLNCLIILFLQVSLYLLNFFIAR